MARGSAVYVVVSRAGAGNRERTLGSIEHDRAVAFLHRRCAGFSDEAMACWLLQLSCITSTSSRHACIHAIDARS